jgi:phospholipase C
MLTATGACGDGSTALPGPNGNAHAQGRCGYAVRQPFLVVSPWARHNFVDHMLTDQTSVIRFIEDNWLGGKRIGDGSFDALANSIVQMFDFSQRVDEGNNGRYLLDPLTGEPSGHATGDGNSNGNGNNQGGNGNGGLKLIK